MHWPVVCGLVTLAESTTFDLCVAQASTWTLLFSLGRACLMCGKHGKQDCYTKLVFGCHIPMNDDGEQLNERKKARTYVVYLLTVCGLVREEGERM